MPPSVARAFGSECFTVCGASTICVPAISRGVPTRASAARCEKSLMRELSSARRANSVSRFADSCGLPSGGPSPIASFTWSSSFCRRSRCAISVEASAAAASLIRRTWSVTNASATASARSTASAPVSPVALISIRLLVRPAPS